MSEKKRWRKGISHELIREHYIEWCKKRGIIPLSAQETNNTLTDMFKGQTIPCLKQARKDFAEYLGEDVHRIFPKRR